MKVYCIIITILVVVLLIFTITLLLMLVKSMCRENALSLIITRNNIELTKDEWDSAFLDATIPESIKLREKWNNH